MCHSRSIAPCLFALVLLIAGCEQGVAPWPQSADANAPSVLGDAAFDGGSSTLDLGPLPVTEFLDEQVGLGGPVIDANPDEAGNLWAVTPDALYIRHAGEARFRRYTNADGLHIYSVITAVAGAGPDEGYVGLKGYEDDAPYLDPREVAVPGKLERVWLQHDGTLRTLHYDELHVHYDRNSFMERTAERLLYVHAGVARGHLFMGGDHGVVHFLGDTYGDHIHVEFYFLPDAMHPVESQSYGLWFGLAVDEATGELWTCGKTACGLQRWNPDPVAWLSARYEYAFTVFTDDHQLGAPWGHRELFVGTALSPDGTAWFLSLPYGLASWQPHGEDYQNIRRWPLPGFGVPVDVAADPDNTVWIADTGHVLRLDPQTGGATTLPLPSTDIRRLYVDAHATPRALYVSTGHGLYIYRGP